MKKKKLLIVDDQKEIIRMIASTLKEIYPNMFQIVNASNGEVAQELAQAEQPDIILMDWDMPVMDGITATRLLKESEQTYNIPVIISTGKMTSSEDLRIALEAGAVDFVRKPIDHIELTARINTALRIKEQHEAIQQLLQNEIELKNRKLSSTSMLIVEKNNLLGSFFQDLEGLERQLKKDIVGLEKQLRTLKKRVQGHIELDSSWDTFKLHFDEVHPQFFELLVKDYGELSYKDLKLCAYLRIGMDNKQLARLLNITAPSARTALFRLKKKLGLKEEEDLRKTILGIG